MNFKKLGLAVLAASVFTFIACDNTASADSDDSKGESEQVVSSDSNDGDQAVASSSSAEEPTNPDNKDAGSGDSGADSKTETNTNPGSDSGTEPLAASSSSEGGENTLPTSVSSYVDFQKCNEEGAVQNMGMAVLVCKNGKWDYDSTATAEANKCDEEGATKTDSTSMMGMTMKTTYVCEKGQWKLDLSGFGGDWTPGDSSGTGFKWNFGDSTGTGFNWDFGDSSGTGFNFGDSSFTLPGGNGGNWDIRPVVKDTTAAP